MSCRVLVADDHPIVLQGLETVIRASEGFVLVGTAHNGRQVLERAAATSPDLVVMDLHMPEIGGVEATRRLLVARPDLAVLVLSMHDDDDHIDDAMSAGARGYLLKREGFDAIVAAMRTVAAGGAVFSAGVSARVLGRLSGARRRAFPGLTDRELELLALLASGGSTQAIARRLFISEKTARNHVSNMMHKLHVTDRAQLIALAREAGLQEATGGGRNRGSPR